VVQDRLFIERFEGAQGVAEVHEVIAKDASGVEQVVYEVTFGGERHEVLTMGEASVLASELAGDARFRNGP
jgi:hypothetical protein